MDSRRGGRGDENNQSALSEERVLPRGDGFVSRRCPTWTDGKTSPPHASFPNARAKDSDRTGGDSCSIGATPFLRPANYPASAVRQSTASAPVPGSGSGRCRTFGES